jgi:hypothetical protein
MRRLPQSVLSFPASLLISIGLLFVPMFSIAQAVGAGSGNGGTLVIAPTEIYLGHVIVGQSKTVSCMLTNGGPASVTISKATSSNAAFRVTGLGLPKKLAVGQSVTFTVQFAPSAFEYVIASIVFVSNASNPGASLLLHGTGVEAGTLVASPAPVFFGKVESQGSKQLSVVVKNVGYTDVEMSHETLMGTGFSLSGLSLPLKLTPGESITFRVLFAPGSAGVVRGSLSLASNATNPNLTVPVFGTGLPPGALRASAPVVYFGQVAMGMSKEITAFVTAVGEGAEVLSATTDNTEFTVVGTTFPLTIPAGTTAPINLRFQPQHAGVSPGTVSFVSNTANALSMQVYGTGTASASLSWLPSTSVVSGYNVYRSRISGGPYHRLTPALDMGTTYKDSGLLGGVTYYYVVTAVDSQGVESGYSNQALATVPGP